MPASALDVIGPAFQHTINQLFKPFRFGQWTRLAFTGLLAGELSGGTITFRIPAIPPRRPQHLLLQTIAPVNVMFAVGIALLIVLAVAVLVALLYVSSRMRFVLFDSIVGRECHIRRYWNQRGEPAFRYFLFQLLFFLAAVLGFLVLSGTAVTMGFVFGWFRSPREHVVSLVVFGLIFVLLFLAFIVIAAVVAIMAKDFVVPQMALENITVTEAWDRLWSMVAGEKGRYAAYIGLKILLSIVAAIVTTIASVLLVLALLIPIGAIAAIVVFGGRAIGLVWNVFTIAIAVTAGVVVLIAVVFGLLLAFVPSFVFFPAYAIYFFAARYPALNSRMYPSTVPPES